jgi:ketosteroid isomerase-like protein
VSVDRAAVGRWLTDYIEAWKSNDPEAIGALFSENCAYRYHPADEPLRGRDAIVTSWLEDDPDEPGTFDARYEPIAVDGEVAIAVGESTYAKRPGGPVDSTYDNCFVLRFDGDGRCAEFTEWYVKRPEKGSA